MGDKTYQEERDELLQQTKFRLERGVKFSPLELAALTPKILAHCHCPFNLAESAYHLARDVAVKLALEYTSFLEALKEDASHYASTACMDDGSPYNPNPFDVLAQVADVAESGRTKEKIPSLVDHLKGALEHYSWVFSTESKELLAKYFAKDPQPQRCS